MKKDYELLAVFKRNIDLFEIDFVEKKSNIKGPAFYEVVNFSSIYS